MEAAVSELHLRLDADSPRDLPAGDMVGEVVQQRALAHARLAPQDGDPAPASESIGQQLVERLALDPTSQKSRRSAARLSDQRPLADVSNWSVGSSTRPCCTRDRSIDDPASRRPPARIEAVQSLRSAVRAARRIGCRTAPTGAEARRSYPSAPSPEWRRLTRLGGGRGEAQVRTGADRARNNGPVTSTGAMDGECEERGGVSNQHAVNALKEIS